MSRACYLLLQTVACWWVTLGVAQKYLHLAAKTWWISGTPQRNVWYLSQSRQRIEVTKLRESLKGRFHPLKGTGYGFIFKPFAFKVLHPADLSFRISVSLVQFIFLKKKTKKKANQNKHQRCRALAVVLFSFQGENPESYVSKCWLIVGLPSECGGLIIRFFRETISKLYIPLCF